MPCKNDIRRKFSNFSNKTVYLNDGLTKLKKKKTSLHYQMPGLGMQLKSRVLVEGVILHVQYSVPHTMEEKLK